MTHDELRELEKARRKALWALASLHPGNPEAFDHLAILDHLDNLQQNSGACPMSYSTSMWLLTLSW